MTASQLITVISQATWILIALLALLEFLRHRDKARLDILLMFGDMALIVLLQWVPSDTSSRFPWLVDMTQVLLVAHPYLLLRLVEHLRTIPRRVTLSSIFGLALSILFIIIFPVQLPPLETILVVIYFVAVEVYCAGAMVRGALRTSGVTHWRLLLAAAGSLLIAAVIGDAGVSVLFPATAPYLTPVSQVLSLFAVISYYFGFAPPAWLRHAWQLSEMYRFINEASGQRVGEPLENKLQRLCSTAERATGGIAAAVTIWDDKGKRLVLRASTNLELIPQQILSEQDDLLRNWRSHEAELINLPVTSDKANSVTTGNRISSILAAPISTLARNWGLVLVFQRRSPLFAMDDLSLLKLLGEQTAITLGYVTMLSEQSELIEQLRRYNQRLESVNEIDRAILAARSPQKIASAALSHLRQLVPCQRAGVVLIDSEKGQAFFVAADDPENIGPQSGEILPLEHLPPLDQLSEGQAVYYVPDISTIDPCPPILEQLCASGIRSVIRAPLINEGVLIGELALSSTQIDAFRPEHQEIARQVADQLAITLQQAHLREELQRYAAELEQRVADRTAQLDEANQELEAFVYSVSHDLRAPLRAIDGFSRVLVTQHSSQLSSEGIRYLQLVRRSAQQMGQLIDDLLSFSRLSRQPVEKQTIAPAEIVRLVLKDLLREQNGRKVDIQVEDMPPCEGDPTLIRQVWTNLLSNALKFTSKREQARIEVGCLDQNGKRIYYVNDNGVGFEMQYADKLFQVFQRLHLQDDFEGTGVGLAIVQRILQRHGGQVWAEAEVDQGARFYFTLE